MIINHNLNATNAHRNMGINTVNSGKSMEKLASGLRINRAGDDAAGLAISEKMRGQIRGLDQAGRNAQDGISMIQTAEGALNETHSILQRMRELAVQSSNDTNTSVDRTEIQKEINQLTNEINRVGNNTEFNTQKLLNGEKTNKMAYMGAGTVTGEPTVSGTAGADFTLYVRYNGGGWQQSTDGAAWGAVAAVNGITASTAGADASATGVWVYTFKNGLAAGSSSTLQIGANQSQQFSTELRDMRAAALGISGLTGGSASVTNAVFTTSDALTDKSITQNEYALDISTATRATAAVKVLDNAISEVSGERSKLGAYQNRLEHTIANLGTASENLTSAESRIRDVDMAKEMMSFSKNNILSQAAQAMLAQANQQPQGVLQLLR